MAKTKPGIIASIRAVIDGSKPLESLIPHFFSMSDWHEERYTLEEELRDLQAKGLMAADMTLEDYTAMKQGFQSSINGRPAFEPKANPNPVYSKRELRHQTKKEKREMTAQPKVEYDRLKSPVYNIVGWQGQSESEKEYEALQGSFGGGHKLLEGDLQQLLNIYVR